MNVEHQNAERVLKLLLETFPESPRNEGRSLPLSPEHLETTEPPLLAALAHEPFDHGISELNSPLSE